jgi:DNA processing protein
MKQLTRQEFPPQLLEIPEPPELLYIEGTLPPPGHTIISVVGARRYTSYGKDVCERLVMSLIGKPVSIVSGLALGIDSIAHKTALAAGLHTLAIPGSGLNRDVLYPASNKRLAEEILAAGGGLISEFEPNFTSTPWAFPKRNRIMAGLSKAVLIIEAEKKSGTLITSRLATDYNRDVLAVPGSIFSKNSEGPHLLIRLGATPITSTADLHEALGFESLEVSEKTYDDCSPFEKSILELLIEPLARDELIQSLKIPIHEAYMLISQLEIKGHIKEQFGLIQKV